MSATPRCLAFTWAPRCEASQSGINNAGGVPLEGNSILVSLAFISFLYFSVAVAEGRGDGRRVREWMGKKARGWLPFIIVSAIAS